MELPTVKSPPKSNLSDFTVLIYGPPKIGKSTFASHAPSALFLATEPGLNSLDVFEQPINTWPEMLEAAALIAGGKHDFKTVVIDTVDNLYKMCSKHMCDHLKITHESDMGYGKGFKLVNNEFARVMTKLGLLPEGLYLISHATDRTFTTRTGEYTKTVPTLPNSAREILLGMVDIILYCDIEKAEGKPPRRVVRTKPSTSYEAGDRTGRLPEMLDLDFAKFVTAFNGGKK